ncbi:hypothetical protein AGABI2DRAFT_178864 [Agaricus bisporus var. bisporus H97]|uniref:hypothetical protein n=1 Tax=Agaricus bisporus var. bisporus (strain H97 / ATCC MYA-4626 / FGSC 10389) TaxID=936046 RepID=UPI00029F7836|nr:hypothetical protein AGABI2DRAFT_178864 [Agaricus bisporus var. bisporus H97]EKV46562.1 hypothetical protein AGABI2DRAFT_178864 [Agaricus bisporus var. bisporus H97]
MPPHQRTTPQIPSLPASPPLVLDGSSRTFTRLSSLKQTIRTATRSKKSPASEADDPAATITLKGKGKEVVTVEDVPKERDRMNVFGKLGTTFRRARKESSSQLSQGNSADHNDRAATRTTYTAPSLRGASLSSPALHLSSQALPSPKSQPSVLASSSSGAAALVSPTRDRSKRVSLQPHSPETGSPVSRRERQTRNPSTRHRATKSNPPDPAPTLKNPPRGSSRHPDSQSPRPSMDTDSLPETPSPSPPAHRGRLVFAPPAARSESSTTRTARPTSPLRARSPTHPRVFTPTTRGLTSSSTSHLPSSSPSHRRSSVDAPRRSSIDSSRRPSVDSPRRNSGETSRLSSRGSPVDRRVESPTPVRPRPISPQQRSYAQNRHYNISSASLISPSYNAEHRERIRKAASMLCKEMIRPPSFISRSDQAKRDWEAVEIRMQPLARLERVWGMSSISSSNNLNSSTSGISSNGSSGVGEERERRAFCEALRDGFVLCQLMNKLRGGNAVRPDPREDGFIKSSNVTRFLAGCASYGLGSEDLFQRDDLIEGTGESLARVAHTIIALIQFVETPAPSRIKWIKGASQRSKGASPTSSAVPGPYMKGSIGRAASSTPNLSPQSVSPRKRYSPPAGLPPLRSDSSEEALVSTSPLRPVHKSKDYRAGVNVLGSDSEMTTPGDLTDREGGRESVDNTEGEEVVVKSTPVAFVLKPPPKSPLRARTIRNRQERNDQEISEWARKAAVPSSSPTASRMRYEPGSPTALRHDLGLSRTDSVVAESTRASVGSSSFLGSPVGFGLSNESSYARQSVASTAMTDTTITTQVSSILDHSPRVGRSSDNNKFGTIRTMTTDLTSESPSIGRAEGADIVEESTDGNGKMDLMSLLTPPTPPPKGHRERRGSNTHGHAVDLTRVAEEPDESGLLSCRGKGKEKMRQRDPKGKTLIEESSTKGQKQREGKGGKGGGGEESEKAADRIHAVHLHKAKWPDDFLEAFQMRNPISRSPSPLNSDPLPPTHSYPTPVSRSVSPPSKLAIVDGGRRLSDSSEVACLAPRRPTHLSRHSLDTPGSGSSSSLLPKEASQLRRDVSPDGVRGASGSGSRLVVRRTSTNKSLLSQTRTSNNLSRYPPDVEGSESREKSPDGIRKERRGSSGIKPVPVPFPRGEHSNTPSPSPRTESVIKATRDASNLGAAESAKSSDATAQEKRPRPPRGRFQSEINGSSRVKLRPNSYDELGARPVRSRIESMVNLGRADAALASASDLMVRDSADGSAVRKTLVVKEEGKPPTHFQLGNCIGKGQFGSVYRALNLTTGQMVAVKRLRLEGLKEDEISTLMREVDLLKSLSHPGIVKYEGMTRDDDTLNIILEYAENGSLAHTLKAFGKLNEKLVASYVVKILEGLHYLHQSDVVHCDLKAANILTTKNGNVKLSDFGVSLNLRAVERQTQNDVAGTPNWMAPEVIELKGASTKSDIWSLGCTVIELLTGRPPYGEISNSMTVMFRIVEDEMPIPPGCSELLQDFLEQCFNKNPVMRPNAELLCEHPWLKNNWVALKDLRPQDSIPFLRRVSADLQKSDMTRYFAGLPESPTTTEFPRDVAGSPSPVPPASPVGKRTSNASIRPAPPVRDTEYHPSDHNFVKTTFSKPVVCRVCLENVKKSAVLCAECSLIAHSKCAPNAPPTCDLRSQLLLYAHYAEQGNPAGLYSNPLFDHPEIPCGPTAMSDIPYVAHNTPRTSFDTQHVYHSTSPIPSSPPTAFKFMAAFKRSRSSLTNEAALTSGTQAPEADNLDSRTAVPSTSVNKSGELHFEERPQIPRKNHAVLHKRSRERPRSYTSTSTGLSSLRSATTAAESLNSSTAETGRNVRVSGAGTTSSHDRTSSSGHKMEQVKSRKTISIKTQAPSGATSDVETNDFAELSTASSILPGSLSLDTNRRTRSKHESKQSGNCIVQ